MSNRREFISDVAGGAAAVLMVACGLVPAAARSLQPTGTARRRQVMVGGRPVKTVDVHCHCIVPGAIELTGRKTAVDSPLLLRPDRLRAMDEQGIDIQALSINPFWYGLDRELARKIIDLQNATLAELCSAQPDRYVAFATVALQHPDLAAQQLEHAVRSLGLRGAAIGGSVEGEEISAPKFDAFWAKAEELGTLIFIHPQNAPGRPSARLQGNGVLGNVIGNPLETTIALSHLIFEGTLDRFPKLKICAAHGGGYLPSYSARSDHGCLVFPEQCTQTLRKRPSEYLRDLYFDSLVFTPEALRHLVAECGPTQIVMGTDYPFPWTSTAVDHVLATPDLTDGDRRAILGETAQALLKIG